MKNFYDFADKHPLLAGFAILTICGAAVEIAQAFASAFK